MANKPKYGTPEYFIEEAEKSLAKVKASFVDFKKDVGEIQELTPLNFSFSSFDHYYNRKYRIVRFDPNNKKHVELAFEEFEKNFHYQKSVLESNHKENIPKIENNKRIEAAVHAFMKSIGISNSYSVFKKPSNRHRNEKWISKTSGFVDDLTRCCKTNDSYDLRLRAMEDQYKKYRDIKDRYLAAISKKEKEKAKEDKELQKIAVAITILSESGENIPDNNSLLVGKANSIKKEEFIRKNFPDGKELEIKCCDFCDSWVVGEHRCSCGNRRMELTIEGNFLDGFYGYPSAY